MYNDNSYVEITFFAQLSNPVAIAAKKYLPLTDHLRTEDIYIKGGHFYVYT
jgi:hypothetical protein